MSRYDAMTYDQLHDEAASRGLDARGVIHTRDLLVMLLEKHDAEQAPEGEPC